MDYALRREDRAAVLSALQTGEYEAIATSSQTALDELAHPAISSLSAVRALLQCRLRRRRRCGPAMPRPYQLPRVPRMAGLRYNRTRFARGKLCYRPAP
jgi:hypothetical protein